MSIERFTPGDVGQDAPGGASGGLQGLIDAFAGLSGGQSGADGTPSGQELIQAAEGDVGEVNSDEAGNQKYSGGADQPWCADAMNYWVEEIGGKGTGSSMAQSFVGGDGLGHVGVKKGNMLIGGNQGNAVSEKAMPGNYKWNTVENVSRGIYQAQSGPAPDGAIIVTDRAGGGSDPVGGGGGGAEVADAGSGGGEALAA